ncbi:MAG: 16S rRNA (guanine(966)-N(2))-methyltransferase RsmD [Gemmatimonadales bacterium]
MSEIRIIAGRWGRRRLKVPRVRSVRPTPERAREAWLNVLAAELEGARVLDLFAGSGALGLEALSRGAAHATFVERERRVIDCLRGNIAALGAGDACTAVCADVFSYLDGVGSEYYDIAFADPPYARGLADRLVQRYARRPFSRLLCVEYERGERIELPSSARERRYGDTVIAFIVARDAEETDT